MKIVAWIMAAALIACGAASAQQQGVRVYPGTDMPDYDTDNFASPSVDDCVARCVADASCQAFTFAHDQNRCYLKSGVGRYKGSMSATSGIVTDHHSGAPASYYPPPHNYTPAGQTTSCHANGNDTCAGCSITCPAGKAAMCTDGEVHQTDSFEPVCWTQAKCECQ